MAYDNQTVYSGKGTRFRIGSSDFPGVRSISGLGSGGATEIDITALTSSGLEYATGHPDEGSVTLVGNLPLQHPLIKTLQSARNDGRSLSCSIIVGGIPSGQKETDGSGITIQSGVAVTGGGTLDSGKLAFTTTAKANTINPVTLGDYVKYGSNHSVIEELSVVGEKLKIKTAATATATQTSIDLIKPGIKLTFNGRVTRFARDIAVNSVFEYNMDIRISGTVEDEVGDPDVTV